MEKLIRDKIPEIIEADNRIAETYVADDDKYYEFLIEKLKEEHDEFLTNHDPAELIDILEVVYAIAETKGISKEEIERKRLEKAGTKGVFKKNFRIAKAGNYTLKIEMRDNSADAFRKAQQVCIQNDKICFAVS